MHTIDFLAVENEDANGQRSGDAIVLRISGERYPSPAIVVIDAGFTDTGQQVVDHIQRYYDTDQIDLVISTHPDTDHLNGLKTVLEECQVTELLIHQPWLHSADSSLLSNYERLCEIYDLAVQRGVVVSEPFAGMSRFEGMINILGPSQEYYSEQLLLAIDEERTGRAKERFSTSFSHGLFSGAANLLEKVASYLPFETLTDEDDTGPRNKTSVVTLLDVEEARTIFTGDTGIEGLSNAIDEYESLLGPISSTPPVAFQVPHHGSKHNLGPQLLDRILGSQDAPYGSVIALISSAKAAPKHPSPKVTNALNRRGASVYATEGKSICFFSPGDGHPEYGAPVTPIGPLEEGD